MPDANNDAPLPIAVLISGGGTTLRNLIERVDDGSLNVDIKLVISSNPTVKGLVFARDANIPAASLQRGEISDAAAYSASIFARCREANVRLVVMGGFLKYVPIPDDFQNRVMNIHPGLIPAFCGKGMYGDRVHQAVLDYGAKITGCTVHFVDNVYDHGPIVLQRTVPVIDSDTAHTPQERVFAVECEAYPAAIALYAAGRLRVDGRTVSTSEG